MPPIRIFDRTHSPREDHRARIVIALGKKPGFTAKLGLVAVAIVRRAFFRMSQAAFALYDVVGSLPDRWAAWRGLPGSTRLAYGAVAILAAILIKDMFAPVSANVSATSVIEKRPDWIEIARAHASFALDASVLEGLEARFIARRHRIGGGRKDELTYGDPVSYGPYVRVSLYRPGAEGMAEPDPLAAVVALASESGINAELQETSGKLRTKFGDLPAINMRVMGKDGWRNCLAATGAWSDPRFGLVAWWCNTGPEIVALGKFACVVDRIALMSAGGDEQLADFFARAELRRSFCDSQSSFVSPTPRMVSDWISTKQTPPLRGRLSAR